MKTKGILYIALVLLCFSCSEKNSWEITDIEDYTRTGLNSFYTSNQGLSDTKFDKVFYLIMRDCACVEENADFLIENIDKLSDDYLLIIRNPQGNDAWGRLKAVLDQEQVNYVVDEDLGLMEEHGIIFAEDKVVRFSGDAVASLTTFNDQIYSGLLKSL